MDFFVGDYVTRNSYGNDIVFKILKIENDIVYLKGVELRLLADAPLSDIIKTELKNDSFIPELSINNNVRNSEYFFLPGKILHLDGDGDYLERCLNFYKNNNVYAIGKKVKEENMSDQLLTLLNHYKPDIVVITGHDSFDKKKGNINNINDYKNSFYFVKAVQSARNYEKSHDKLVIIAGACQSDYEDLIKAGANFASSPKRINIHALDPAIIATSVATTKRNDQIDLINVLNKTKYGSDGIGGIMCNGLMYVGFPK